jgi:hypothetical protein
VALDREDAGHVVQLLGHVFADALELAAAAAGGVVGLVVDLGARQIGRQRGALGLLLDRLSGLAWRDAARSPGPAPPGRHRWSPPEALLLGVEGLGLGGELQPLEHRHLVGELVDGGLLEGDLGRSCWPRRAISVRTASRSWSALSVSRWVDHGGVILPSAAHLRIGTFSN